MSTDRRLTLVPCFGLPDWYCIEWQTHGNRHWHEFVQDVHGPYIKLMYSGRVADADVEGTSAEMRDLMTALLTGASVEHRRCAVRALPGGFDVFSPRNSRMPAFITTAQADQLAAEMARVLGDR